MNVSYFLKHNISDITWHAKMLMNKINTNLPLVKTKIDTDLNSIKIIVYAKDNKGLFTKIVEFFDSISFNVQDAKINTTKHGYALNSFLLTSNIDEKLNKENIK